MEERDTQIEMWTLLGSTAEQLAGGLRSPKSPDAEAPGKSQEGSEAPHFTPSEQKRTLGGKEKDVFGRPGSRLNEGTPARETKLAKGSARIMPAKHGNAFVVVRRRD